jgi:predicted phosphodiesterase
MRVAALYDIHANLPALQAVIDDLRQQGIEQVIIGGDVLPGPLPRETLEVLLHLEIPAKFIMGNGDREVLARIEGSDMTSLPKAARKAIEWTAQQLSRADERLIRSWPATLALPVVGLGDVLFCHATPRNNTEIFTRVTEEERLLAVFAGVKQSIVVCGHTHMQFDRTVGSTRVVNAGSVGMPFGRSGADWLLLGQDVQLRHTAYDLARAAEEVRKTSYAEAAAFADNYILHPPSEEQMLALYAGAELR